MSTELGMVHTLGVEAIGQPGQRRFRLFVQSSRGAAFLWVEKEYLTNLSLTIDRALAQLSEGKLLRTEAQAGAGEFTPSGLPKNFPRTPDYEFQVGQLGLSYEENRDLFVVIAMPLEIIMEEGDIPAARLLEEEALSFLFTQQQAYDLTRTINAVIASGRPVCPLCHMPLDGGPHACVKQNGHRQIVRLDEGDEGDEEE